MSRTASYEDEWLDYLCAARTGAPRRWRLGHDELAEAAGYATQDALLARIGPVAGWKTGAASLSAPPNRGALAARTIRATPATVSAAAFTVTGVEAELVFAFARDLPPRAHPYSRDDVLAAISTVHAAIEIIDTRYAGWGIADRGSQIADQMNHGLLVVGDGVPIDRTRDWSQQPFALALNGETVRSGVGGNTAVDPVRLLVWLANEGSTSLGGLAAGHVVTTGSCSGSIFVGARTHVRATFPGIGQADLEIAAGAPAT